MKLRTAKKLCKACIREYGWTVTRTIRRLFVIKPSRGMKCMRWYAFTIATEDHERLPALIAEQRDH